MKVNDVVTKVIDLVGRTLDLTVKALIVCVFLAGGWFLWNAIMHRFDDGSGGGVYTTTLILILYVGIGGSLFSALWDKLSD